MAAVRRAAGGSGKGGVKEERSRKGTNNHNKAPGKMTFINR